MKTILLFTSFFLIRSLVISGVFRFTVLIFPDSDSLFSLYKFFFLSYTILILLEYLIAFELPPNFLFSRAAALASALLLATVFQASNRIVFGGNAGVSFLILMTAVCFLFGQVVSYRLQQKRTFRHGYGLGFFGYFLIAGILLGEVFVR